MHKIFLHRSPIYSENLTVHSQWSSILLTWTPPFSLDITGVDPDTHGRVFAANTSGRTFLGGVKGTGISNLVIHITDCTLQFNHNYTMTMEVGEGDRSVLMFGDLSMLNSLVDLHFAFVYQLGNNLRIEYHVFNFAPCYALKCCKRM